MQRPLADPGKEDRSAHGVPVVPAYDGYRAFAILAIVFLHVLANSGVVSSAGGGWGGQLIWGTLPHLVDVLFIISGFVVFLPTVAQGGRFGSVSAYAIRRAARLLPAFWLSLVILLALIAILDAAPPFPGPVPIGVHLIGEHGVANLFDNSIVAGFGINLPLWTLTLEISFYIVLPFIATAYFRRPLLGLLIAALIAVLWRVMFDNLGDVLGWFGFHPSPLRLTELVFASGNQLPHWAFSFAAGMTSAWAYVRLRELRDDARIARIAGPIALAAFCVLAIFVYASGRYAIDNEAPAIAAVARQSPWIGLGYTAALATLMIALALSRSRLQAPFAHPLARRLGDISYGVYLIHGVLLWFLSIELTSLPTDGTFGAFMAWAAIVIPTSLAYGYLSARYLEQPIRRWARRFGRRAQEDRPGATAPVPP
jgi:peptidoglycan/LPS O-acetylase OafA/YrhL